MLLGSKLTLLFAMSTATTALDILGISIPDGLFTGSWYGAPADDFGCVDPKGRNPVVMVHALAASREVYSNLLYKNMTAEGWCVYAKTYGSPAHVSLIGGLTNMTKSAKEVGAYILEVAQRRKSKIDLVCHSEGGVQCLYVPMTQPNVAAVVDHAIALGPAVHGAHYFGLTDFFQSLPSPFPSLIQKAVKLVCDACIDMENSDGVIYTAFKNSPKIVPDNINATIIMSRYDTLVTPETSEVHEANVRNLFVQDYCPDDHLGHGDLAWSMSVWGMIKNELQEVQHPFKCDKGAPLRV